jgi:hypothetical protein
LNKLCHQLLYHSTVFSYRNYIKHLHEHKSYQLNIWNEQNNLLNRKLSFEEFKDLPITDYSHWAEKIEEQRLLGKKILNNDDVSRYQPTSGSSSAIKWIPYTNRYLKEIDQVAAPWMHDLYDRYPDIREGKHYWSLSWIPTELRDKVSGNINDDLQLMPWWKRFFLGQTMAVSSEISKAPSSYLSQLATASFLASCSDLSLVSVWSPTFFLEMIHFMEKHNDEIVKILRTGDWGHGELSFLEAPFNPEQASILKEENFQKLWSKLTLMSSWDSSTSFKYAKKLQNKFPKVSFQGKGLWATEGVVTFPFRDKFPLAYQSHFYEFLDLEDGKIYNSWELSKDQEVAPVLTTGNGICRYKLYDRLKVTEFMGGVPCFLFMGREHGVDMVGEKLSPNFVTPIIHNLEKEFDVHSVCLAAVAEEEVPFYLYIAEGQSGRVCQKSLADKIDESLCQSFHYNLARDLGQLDPVKVLVSPDGFDRYKKACVKKGMVAGNLKIESLVKLNQAQYKELYHPSC